MVGAVLDFGMPWFRAVLAFLVAPAVGILTAWLIVFCLWAMPFAFSFSLAPVAYGVTFVIGVPAFFLLRWWKLGLVALWWYVIAGFVIACFVAVPLVFAASGPARNLGALIAVSGTTAGLAFGLILQPKPTNRGGSPDAL